MLLEWGAATSAHYCQARRKQLTATQQLIAHQLWSEMQLISGLLQYRFAKDRRQEQDQFHPNLPLSCFPMHAVPRGIRSIGCVWWCSADTTEQCAATLHKDRKHSCQLQPKAQAAHHRAASRDQKWAPGEIHQENAHVAWHLPHVLCQPAQAHSSWAQALWKETFHSVSFESVSLVFVFLL